MVVASVSKKTWVLDWAYVYLILILLHMQLPFINWYNITIKYCILRILMFYTACVQLVSAKIWTQITHGNCFQNINVSLLFSAFNFDWRVADTRICLNRLGKTVFNNYEYLRAYRIGLNSFYKMPHWFDLVSGITFSKWEHCYFIYRQSYVLVFS